MTELKDFSAYHETLPDYCETLRNKGRKCCSIDTVKSFFPVLNWLPKYKAKFLLQDFVAGLTVGLTAIPQAIAYGTIAGLTPQYGLYSAFMGCFIYVIFGTCKDITVGPTAIMALMIQTHIAGNADYAVLSCFLAGCVIMLMGIFNLGVLMQFISVPVTTGFTMAAAITIGSGQINSLFGIESPSNEFVESWRNFFTHIPQTNRNDAILGVATLIALLLLRKVREIPCRHKAVTKYFALSRNALAVIVGIMLCYFLSHDDWLPFKVSGKITSGLPPFKVPPFSTYENDTYISFSEMISNLGPSLVSIPLISILESIAVAKAFSKGKIVDASQEMIALGLCNIFGSFISSIPTTGSFTRTAINNSSGVKTPLGGIVTGTLVIMALAFLTTTFYYIPKATLAGIIIAAMIHMIEYDRIAEIWRAKKIDIIPLILTLLVCLFWSLEYGIVCGIIVNLSFILYHSARPKIIITSEKINGNLVGVVIVQQNLSYSSAEFLKAKIVEFLATTGETIDYFVICGEEINSIDSTVALNIISLKEDLAVLDCKLLCWNWNIAAAGVICRLDHHERNMFIYGKNLSEVVRQATEKNISNGESNSTIVSI